MYNINKSDKSKKEGRMKDNQRLPDAELEIMMAIWDANETVTSEYLMEVLNKDWVKPTLLNLLNRFELPRKLLIVLFSLNCSTKTISRYQEKIS